LDVWFLAFNFGILGTIGTIGTFLGRLGLDFRSASIFWITATGEHLPGSPWALLELAAPVLVLGDGQTA
jgi:hypothetical protein